MRAYRELPSLFHFSSDRRAAQLLRWAALLAIALAVAAALWSPAASAATGQRGGKAIYDDVCAACHATGRDGAPRVGDRKAWAARASQGLTALSGHALEGIRKMPAHGGSATVSDREITLAVTYMVNQSGGHWIEPRAASSGPRVGEEIVQAECSKCHESGVNGAPKIGDRAAWIPRMSRGLDQLVKSAVHGHGAMPARGGVADLTDREIESAVVHMFNYGVVAAPSAPRVVPVAADPFHKVVGTTDVYLGVVKADAMPAAQRPAGIATGKGYYHVNISLTDVATKTPVKGARVRVQVADATGVETKTLEPVLVNESVSYGAYFRMSGNATYTITAQIEVPRVEGVGEAKFQYKAW